MTAPRRLVFRGTVLASGYVLGGSARAQAAVLERWRPGHEVWEWGEGQLVWHLPEPERIACELAPGLPLVAVERRLCSAPLAADELDGVPMGITVVEAGRVVSRPSGKPVDVSRWLNVSRFTLAGAVEPLGEPPPPPELMFAPRPQSDARTTLGMKPLEAEAAAVAESLRTGRPLPAAQGQPEPIQVGPAMRGFISGLRRFTRWLSRPFSRASAPQPAGSALAPRQPSWLDRLDAWLARMLETSRLSRVIGQRQADYFSRLMQMFEQNDLDAALRHAVPLNNQPGQGESRPTLATPSPRASLEITMRPRTGGAPLQMQYDLFEELRRRYRAAAEKLEREGRYKEAAFVLAELLNADEEAIALLERHQLYELAAELAESRQLSPGLQVRQWFLAKNVERAVAVARRHGVFGDAVARLSRSKHDAEARQLRLLWADSQASSGDFYNAVVTLWPLDDSRALARRWLELGIAQGGLAAARLEVKRLVLDAEKADPSRLVAAFDSDDAEHADERALLATELQAHATQLHASAARPLARSAVRSVMRDALGSPPLALVNLAADGALKADLPPHRLPDIRLTARNPPVRIDVEAYDRGALPVHDAALLPDGRTLVALGEAGVRVLTRDGRTAAHFDVPARWLVPYDHGGRALCVAQRGEVLVLARLDLLASKMEPLPQLRLETWADGTDGSMWFVHDGQALCGLDLHDPGLKALWRVAMPVPYGRPRRSPLSLSMMTSPVPGELEWWRYELPSLTLRVRQSLLLPQVNERVTVLSEGNVCITQGGVAWSQLYSQSNRRQLTGVAGGVIVDVDGAGDWFSLVARTEHGHRWMLADAGGVTVRHVVQLPRATFSIRMPGESALYADSDGRVLVVDVGSGLLLRDFRVR